MSLLGGKKMRFVAKVSIAIEAKDTQEATDKLQEILGPFPDSMVDSIRELP